MSIDIKKHILPIGLLIVIFSAFFYNRDLLGGLVFLVVGFGFLYAGFYIRNTNSRIKTNGIKTQAKIVDFKKERTKDADGDSYEYHFPVVSFTDRNGVETTQKLDSSENPKRINELIDIIYLKKENEYEIIKDNDWWENNLPMILLIGGFLFSGIGIIWLINKI
ncbi:DUF3592 domain-containing protein [Psychroflexus sp. MES1-P1E]|uniref:DUF3592 domain-containing protein n=1 Tax=Psychroflexus sp. MES1-P1E TaxID=2058320 RepID=UPI000C7AEA42|nr:DUF3592 domain-containing protein [Psychroflexus sp. MES1-P1E]PKG42617.1 hypothetical protein CXF67_09310 [Psychroflexus sp. MES1-P1E]